VLHLQQVLVYNSALPQTTTDYRCQYAIYVLEFEAGAVSHNLYRQLDRQGAAQQHTTSKDFPGTVGLLSMNGMQANRTFFEAHVSVVSGEQVRTGTRSFCFKFIAPTASVGDEAYGRSTALLR
jgi:hypothetical protein